MVDTGDAIECEALRVRRGKKTVLHDLTLRVPRGQVVGLLGPSGGGKTTLMRSIVGVQKVASGSVRVLGRPAGDAGLRRRVGYSTQAASVYDDLTVRQNLSYFRSVLGARPGDVERVLAETRLTDTAGRLVATLSGGEHSRVSLAVAMLSGPELLVLDEPTVGLDPLLREDLWNLFHDLARNGSTLLVSSHVMDEATRCDRLLLVRDGILLADLTPAELLARTGAASAEEAFLTMIRQHPKHRAGES